MDLKTIRVLLGLLDSRRWIIPLVMLLSVIASLAEGIGVGMMIPFLHELVGQGSTAGSGGPVVDWLNAYADLFPEDIRLVM